MSSETLGGETLVQGCALMQYNPRPRPPKFAAPKALLRRVIHLMGGRIPVHGCALKLYDSELQAPVRASYDSLTLLPTQFASNDTRKL